MGIGWTLGKKRKGIRWVGFGSGAPVTQHVSIEAPVYFLHGGAGVSLLNDKIGNEYTRGVNLSYAYQTKLSKKSELGVGLSLGFMDVGFEGEWLTPSNNSGADDPSVPAIGENDIVPDLGLGIYYRMKELYIGYSVTHLNQATAVYGNNDDTDFEFKRHHYFTMGWMHEVSSELVMRPSMFVKTDQISTQIDFNINVMYADHLWGGVTYRLDDAVVLITGYNINENLKFGYAYDITTSDLKSESSGSHEILLRYSFKMRPPGKMPTHYRNIRYN